MKRTHIAALGATLAIATTTALAQNAAGPDFSPMKPRNFDETQAQAAYTSGYDRATPASPDTAPVAPAPYDNRMLDAYESSATVVTEEPSTPLAADVTVAPRPRARTEAAIPRYSTIGHGLFDRNGPNDFGA